MEEGYTNSLLKMTRRFISHISILLLYRIIVCYSFFVAEKAEITPLDALVFVGESLTVNCTLTSSGDNVLVSTLNLKIFYSSTSDDNFLVPKKNITFFNDKISALIKITDKYSTYTTIYCLDGDDILTSTGLKVERPIENVTNFSGVYFYDFNRVDITWSLGKSYLNTLDVIVDWSADVPPNLRGSDCKSSTNESCSILYGGQGVLFFRINISINVGNRPLEEDFVRLYDTEVVSVHKFVPLYNLKTLPVQSVTISNTSSSCVNFTWQYPQYFSSPSVTDAIYRFGRKLEDEDEFIIFEEPVVMPKSLLFKQLCELIPNTKYSLSIEIKARSDSPWSDRAVVDFSTEEDRPLIGPPVNDTGYYTQACQNNKRAVTIYWNDPSKASLQGQLTSYEIVKNNESLLLRPGSNYYQTVVDCSSTYEIFIYTATKLGVSLTPSIIAIPKESEEISVKDSLMFMVEDTSKVTASRTTTNVSVTWTPGDLNADTSIIIYMCQETYPNTCLNDYVATEINGKQGQVQLTDIPIITNLFGYALKNKNGQKKGITWTNCVYRADILPDPPTGLTVSPGNSANSLLITWASMQCSKTTKVLVLQYHIYICPQLVNNVYLCARDCQHVNISNMSINSYLVTNLIGGNTYCVNITAQSPLGIGQPSKTIAGHPLSSVNTGESVDAIYGIAFGTAAFVFLLGLVIFITMKCYFKAKRRSQLWVKSFEYPNVPINETPNNSNSSGIYTGSTQSSNIGSEQLESSSLATQLPVQTSQPPVQTSQPPVQTSQPPVQTSDILFHESISENEETNNWVDHNLFFVPPLAEVRNNSANQNPLLVQPLNEERNNSANQNPLLVQPLTEEKNNSTNRNPLPCEPSTGESDHSTNQNQKVSDYLQIGLDSNKYNLNFLSREQIMQFNKSTNSSNQMFDFSDTSFDLEPGCQQINNSSASLTTDNTFLENSVANLLTNDNPLNSQVPENIASNKSDVGLRSNPQITVAPVEGFSNHFRTDHLLFDSIGNNIDLLTGQLFSDNFNINSNVQSDQSFSHNLDNNSDLPTDEVTSDSHSYRRIGQFDNCHHSDGNHEDYVPLDACQQDRINHFL